jgi:NAD(P)-dependent dehydrogenase (short-subunit alcohol dehydrogenase family)
MRVLVTGTTGMLGRGVALALAGRGDGVTVLQRRPAGLGLPEVLADVADADAVRSAAAGHDAVVHLAAKVNVVGQSRSTCGSTSAELRPSSTPAGPPGWNAWCMSRLPRLPIKVSRS